MLQHALQRRWPVEPAGTQSLQLREHQPGALTDSTGHVSDTLVDVAFIADDIDAIAANGYTAEKGAVLAADVASAAVQGMTGGGQAPRRCSTAVTPFATVASRALYEIRVKSCEMSWRYSTLRCGMCGASLVTHHSSLV
ncbi:MAG: hypothetical protein MI924_12370 [Chloroflexales bacterium]|nr:hypothetical protein [Chloroflexales bacterium]